MDDAPKKVTLIIKDVDPAVRYLFNQACAVNGQSRGEIITQLMKEFGEKTFFEGGAKTIMEHYHNRQYHKSLKSQEP